MTKGKVTIGTIWQDERTNDTFEVTAVNGVVQLSPTNGEQSYKTMKEASLRKHYKLVAMSMREFKPELAVVTTQVEEEDATEEKPKVKGSRIVRFPGISTDGLLEKYGDNISKTGETYRNMYLQNKDNVFRYFKIRLPLLKLAGIK